MSSHLSNPDLAPTSANQRTWRWFHYAALWIGMVVSIPAYMLAAGLIDQGLTPLQAIGTILLGNFIVLIPMLLIGHAGARFGIPYAILVRASFGVLGGRLPAVARALVACGWYGIQTWVGGGALLALVGVIVGRPITGPPLPVVGISSAQLAAFIAFWLIQLAFVVKGLEMVRRLETWTAPIKILICVALLYWALEHTGGLGPLTQAHSVSTPTASHFLTLFWPSLTAMVGYWATLALNIPDFTRFAFSQRDQIIGQTIGLPLPMGLLAFVAIITTGATTVVFGKAIWDPVALATQMPSVGVLVGLLVISIDTVSCNIAANLVGPAYDFASLAPNRLGYRGGAVLTAVLAALIMPWKLLADSNGYIFTWLVGYSALLGPIAGIIIADYWLVRGGQLQVDDLYAEQGAYSYQKGWNPAALAALLAGVAPSAPGFLKAAIPNAFGWIGEGWTAIYPYAWFVGVALGALVYLALTKARLYRASAAVQ